MNIFKKKELLLI
ncbi:UNVERIFIED_CONTAM: hypothetical protein GTU68_054927 [Idotea baltica]|nr:hypothetical protein [Idotea baltica]